MRSAAWRISLLATLAFACGTLVVFVFLHSLCPTTSSVEVMHGSQARLECSGMLRSGRRKMHSMAAVVGEVAELAAREVPNRSASEDNANDSVFFLQTGSDGFAQALGGRRRRAVDI